MMTTRPAPTHALIRMRGSACIQEAAQLMCDMSMGALGVDAFDHEFAGLITERDLLWAVAQGKDPFETTLMEIVNDFPIVLEEPPSVEDAAERMTMDHVRHLIVRAGGDLRIVSMRDLLNEYVGGSNLSSSSHQASSAELGRMFGSAFVRR